MLRIHKNSAHVQSVWSVPGDLKDKGTRIEADALQKAPLCSCAGRSNHWSARVGKLSPIRPLFNVRLAALFHEKGRRPKPTPA